MTLLGTFAASLVLLIVSILLAGAGKRVLRLLRVEISNALDAFLYSLVLGAVLLELAVSAGELLPNVRFGVIAAACLVGAAGLTGARGAFRDLAALWQGFRSRLPLEQALACGLFAVLGLMGLASLAPLTGSDALHYHFTTQELYLRYGFHPDWNLLHGFFCALGHQLILAGLAFGSDRLAMGLIFLGGVAATFATFRTAQQWTTGAWPYAVALAFALTPVTFWQISVAGAPDIWMCAQLPLSVLAILQAQRTQTFAPCILAGILAGALAGSKYTGILMAGALLVAFAVELRSVQKCLAFFSSAVVIGVWPYLRNWIWTGDPIFPFFFSRRHDLTGNLDAIASILRDTGASNRHELGRVLRFPIFAVADSDGLAAWQFLGPLVLAFAPVALLSVRKSPLWRVVLIVWLIVSLGVGATSGIPRFLLPVLPLALSAAVGGVVLLTQQRFRVLRAVTILSVAGFCVAGFGAMVLYSRAAWSVALGRQTPESYLRVHGPDFGRCEFVNEHLSALSRADPSARALIFFRHLYYLHVPFVAGDALDSWEMSPAALSTDQAWRNLFVRRHIRWVVKAPDYPEEFSTSLKRLESDGILKPCASGTVESIQGFRMNGHLASEPIVILCVNP